jgi:8-oxo-dGTP diphosphatase
VAEELPESRRRRAPAQVVVAAALVERDGRWLLVRRRDGPVLAKLWELPQTSLDSRGLPDLAGELEEHHGLKVVPEHLAVLARHAITYRRIRAEGYRCRLVGRPPRDADAVRWASLDELDALPVSSLTRKLLKGLRSGQPPLAFG